MKHTVEIELPDHIEPFVIPVRNVWQWPEWLTAEWIVKSQHTGKWIGSENEPVVDTDNFSGWYANGDTIDLSLTTFVPPPCTDWRTSKRRNPRSKQP